MSPVVKRRTHRLGRTFTRKLPLSVSRKEPNTMLPQTSVIEEAIRRYDLTASTREQTEAMIRGRHRADADTADQRMRRTLRLLRAAQARMGIRLQEGRNSTIASDGTTEAAANLSDDAFERIIGGSNEILG